VRILNAHISHPSFQVNDLIGAGKSYRTLSDILDKDIQNDCVKKQGSHSRNLRRVRLGLGLIKALFEQFLDTEYVSLHSTKHEHISSLSLNISGKIGHID
jgi:hypothetical protein